MTQPLPVSLARPALRSNVRSALMLAVCFFVWSGQSTAQTYDYPFNNATSCAATVEFWWEYTCGVDNLNGYATFSVPAYTTQAIANGSVPEKI